MRNTETTCVIKLDFYPNFYYSIFSTITIVTMSYSILIIACRLTSSTGNVKTHDLKRVEASKNAQVVKHVLLHMPLFERLNGQDLDKMVEAMTLHENLKHGHIVKKEKDHNGSLITTSNHHYNVINRDSCFSYDSLRCLGVFFIVISGQVVVQFEGSSLRKTGAGRLVAICVKMMNFVMKNDDVLN